MTITAVIPAYNSERFLGEALESIAWQTVPVDEILVIDDGSTDCTAAVADAFPSVTLIRKPNTGVSASRNLGIRTARSDYIAFLDADDIWLPDKIALDVAALQSSPGSRIAWGYHLNFVEPGSIIPSWMKPEMLTEPMRFILPSALVVAREVFDSVGFFDETMTHGEDSDWVLRARDRQVPEATTASVVMLRRIHSNNVSHDLERGLRGTMTALRRAVAVRRERATQ